MPEKWNGYKVVGTTLSMTIIAWAFYPVNRNPVPVCVICAPIQCQKENVWKIVVKFVELQEWGIYNKIS